MFMRLTDPNWSIMQNRMSEAVSNSMLVGECCALPYAAYRNAVKKYKQEDGVRFC